MKIIEIERDTNNVAIGMCELVVNEDVWTVQTWFVDDEYQNKGIGRKLFREVFKKAFRNYDKPKEIRYIWDGVNDYVYEWLQRHFDAISVRSIEDLDLYYNESDDPTFRLNMNKLQDYINSN